MVSSLSMGKCSDQPFVVGDEWMVFFHLVIRLIKKAPLFYEELSHTSHQIIWPKHYHHPQNDTADSAETSGENTVT